MGPGKRLEPHCFFIVLRIRQISYHPGQKLRPQTPGQRSFSVKGIA